MALKNGKVNKLNTLGLRKVTFPAHHFHYTNIEKFNPSYLKRIDTWIYNNLNHRYYIGCLLYTSPSPRDRQKSRMPSSA